jgi:hypothetical protein
VKLVGAILIVQDVYGISSPIEVYKNVCLPELSVDPATNWYLDRRLIRLYSNVCKFLAENDLRHFVLQLVYRFFADIYWVMASPNYTIWTR